MIWEGVWGLSCLYLKGGFVFFDLGTSQVVTSKKLRKGLQDVSGKSGKTSDKSQECPLVPL